MIDSKEKFIEFLNEVLYFKGRGANNGVWESYKGKEEGSRFIDLLRPHSWKTLGKVRIYYYVNEYPDDFTGHEFKIDIMLNSYCEWEPMFEGWIEQVVGLEFIFNCLGIPFDIKTNDT